MTTQMLDGPHSQWASLDVLSGTAAAKIESLNQNSFVAYRTQEEDAAQGMREKKPRNIFSRLRMQKENGSAVNYVEG